MYIYVYIYIYIYLYVHIYGNMPTVMMLVCFRAWQYVCSHDVGVFSFLVRLISCIPHAPVLLMRLIS